MNPDFDKPQPYPLMLFPGGDPREAYAIADDAESEKALRGQGYKSLTDSGLHPDQFRDDAAELHGNEFMTDDATPKRGPGRPKKG